MKKLLTLAALVGATTLTFGQGYVQFFNGGQTAIKTNGTAVANVGGSVGSWYFALLWAPTTQTTVDASLSGWTFGAYGTNTTLAGRLEGSMTSDGSGTAVAGLTGTSTANFIVVGWSGNWGSSWSTVFDGKPLTTAATGGEIAHTINGATSGWYGISRVGTGAAGTGIFCGPSGGPYGTIFGTGAGFINGFNLNYYTTPVPEPSTFALAGLGAAALMIIRRRK